ncbi:MAG: efflux RND transporter periplasmic adaptor subunit, partial [bacterium]
TQTVPVIGKLVAKQSGAATARIAGTVSRMLVEVGDRVRRNQPLARIDAADLRLRARLARAQRAEAEARRKTAEAQLALARQEVERLSELADSAAVSRAAYDDAQHRHNIAAARLREASAAIESGAAQLALAELELGYAVITAPFAGAVTARLAEVGDYLQRGQAAARLVSDQRLEVEADVPYGRLGGLSPGTAVELLLDNASRHRAEVRAIVAEEDPRTRTRRVRFVADFDAAAGRLAAQQSVTVLIPAGAARDIVSVHKDAVVRRAGGAIVFVVADGVAALRDITTGASSGERLEVLDGLSAGDLTVVRGNERLTPNQPVRIAPAQ